MHVGGRSGNQLGQFVHGIMDGTHWKDEKKKKKKEKEKMDSYRHCASRTVHQFNGSHGACPADKKKSEGGTGRLAE